MLLYTFPTAIGMAYILKNKPCINHLCFRCSLETQGWNLDRALEGNDWTFVFLSVSQQLTGSLRAPVEWPQCSRWRRQWLWALQACGGKAHVGVRLWITWVGYVGLAAGCTHLLKAKDWQKRHWMIEELWGALIFLTFFWSVKGDFYRSQCGYEYTHAHGTTIQLTHKQVTKLTFCHLLVSYNYPVCQDSLISFLLH